MSTVENLTSDSFDAKVKNSQGLVFVEFYADWCPDCGAAGPVYESFSQEFSGKAGFMRIDTHEYPDKAQEYGVRHIPHFILFENGTKVREAVEITSREALVKLLTGEN